MKLFKPQELTEEEKAREAEAKAQVLSWLGFGTFKPDDTMGEGSLFTFYYMKVSLIFIVLSGVLHLTGVIDSVQYAGGVVALLIFGSINGLVSLYFARKDYTHANGS